MNLIQQAQLSPLHWGRPGTGNLDELHSTFVQNVSHELRTPLGIIQGYAELLRDGDLGALALEQQEAVGIIVNRAYELRTLVERVAILMAIEAHMGVSEPLALTEIVAGVVEGKRAAATQTGIRLETRVEPRVPLVSGDLYHLQQAVECLVENGLKFTPGGGRVEVQVYASPPHDGGGKGGSVCLAVTDSGVGMTEEEVERIVSDFCQADGSTTRRYGGIGLGLTVAKAVIKEHAGKIELESQAGQGSRFVIELPALPPDGQADQAIEESVALRRILIVDDEENIALTLQDGLKRLPNCEITIATSGEQALGLFEQQPFDLLITDYKMPGTDGITLAARVRQLYPRTVIIMITAYGDETLREQAARASIQRVLDKPVGLAEVRCVALEALGRVEEHAVETACNDDRVSARVQQATGEEGGPERSMNKTNILVVEDENIVALDLENGLKSLGYSVPARASSGEEAIQKAAETRPDLVLMDIQLKGDMDGIEAAGEIRARFDIPVIYLTAFADDDIVRRAGSTEPYGYLIKPFEERQLHASVEMALHKHRMEKALRESERRYRLLAENVTDVIWTTDMNLQLTYISPSVSRLLGYSVEEAMAQTMEERLTPASLEVARETFAEALAVDSAAQEDLSESRTLDLEFTRKDGSTVWTEVKVTLLRDPDGRPVGILGITRDITERKRVEEMLRRRAAELEALAQVSSALRAAQTVEEILSIVLEQTIQVIAATLRQAQGGLFGSIFLVKPETGDLVAQATHPPDLYPFGKRHHLGQGTIGHVAATGEIYISKDLANDPLACIRPGEAQYLSTVGGSIALPLRTQERSVGVMNIALCEQRPFTAEEVRLLTATADIAANALHRALVMEGLEAEVAARTAEIRAEREKSETILRSVGDAIIMTDLERRIQYVNEAFTTLTGHSAAEVLGHQVESLIEEAFTTLSEQAWQSLQPTLGKKGQALQKEVTIRRKDGRTYDAALTIAVVRDTANNLVGYVFSHRDISRLKDLDRARSQFITNVSHELRTPATVLKAIIYLLRKGRKPEQTEVCLQMMEDATERLIHLIEDILEMAVLDSSQAVTIQEPVFLSTVIGDIVTRYQARAEAFDLTLAALPIPSDLPAVKGDQDRLIQALGEIVENAVIFTPAGGQVRVKVETVEDEGYLWVTVAVQDTGPGVSPEEQGKVFDRFFRGSLAESGTLPGTGLGLSITQEIMRAHGGRVTVESEVGNGSTFRMWLPYQAGSEHCFTLPCVASQASARE